MKKYYGKNKHLYMSYKDSIFSEYIDSILVEKNAYGSKKCASVIEIGAGMGRFSHSLVKEFKKVYLIEPVKDYSDFLQDIFKEENVEVVNMSANDFLKQYKGEKDALVFSAHLLHHLTVQQRKEIFCFIKEVGAKAVFIEPNPYNPLFLFQILLHPDMSFHHEREYLKITPKKMKRELISCGLENIRNFKICFFPPVLTDLLLRSFLKKMLRPLEKLNDLAPFFGSYQVLCCQGG